MRYPRSIPLGNGSRIFLLETRAAASFFRIPLSRKLNWLNYMRWVKNGAAELGFVFPDDNGQLDYGLRRYQLQFEALRTVNGMLYMSPKHMSGMQKSSRDSGKQMRDILPESAKKAEKLHALRYIQMGQDEFSGEHLWQDKEKDGFREADF